MRNGIAAFVVLIVVAAAAPAGFAQESFEVASVKKHLPDDTALGGVRVLPGRRFDIRGLPLRALVFLAYGSDSIVAPTQVVDGPAWVDADMFDVSAKGAGVLSDANGFTPHLVAMIRALLTERFALRVHPAKRELPVYELVRARPSGVLGPRLLTSITMCPTPSEAALPASPERWCGVRRSLKTSDDGLPMVDVHAQGVTMADVALHFALYPFIARPIFDQTGLVGRYDIVHLDYVATRMAVQGAPGVTVDNPQVDHGPSLFTALVEQLGLRLRGAKAPVDVVVIDEVGHPME